jgi:excinuclease UvrABC nuclease subunit
MSEWSERYQYNTEKDVNSYAPSKAGVYRLIYHSGDKYYVFYVGQSENLKERLLSHLNTSEPNACIKKHLKDYTCYFRCIEVTTQEERNKIEEQQIDEYSPSCNKTS